MSESEETRLKLDNQLLARFLSDEGLILSDDVILEYVRHASEAVALDEVFRRNPKIIICEGEPAASEIHNHVINNFKLSDDRINLISNAFNGRVAKACKGLLPYGRFNIGICTSEPDEFEGSKLKLVKFQRELIASGIKVSSFEKEFGERKLYVLSNRRRLNGK